MWNKRILACGAVLALLLCGCAARPDSAPHHSPSPAPSPEPQAAPGAPASSTAAGSTAAPAPTAESTPAPVGTDAPGAEPVPTHTIGPEGEWNNLDFLTEEQRAAYEAAVDTLGYMLGESCNIAFREGNCPGREFRLENGVPYVPVRSGPDSDYETFRTRMLGIYTGECLEKLNFDTRFLSVDGTLAANSSGFGSNPSYVGEGGCPDSYRLDEQGEERVCFTITAHFIGDREGETMDEMVDRREAGGFDWTDEYPIRLVNTPDGWRVDEFHSPYYW